MITDCSVSSSIQHIYEIICFASVIVCGACSVSPDGLCLRGVKSVDWGLESALNHRKQYNGKEKQMD